MNERDKMLSLNIILCNFLNHEVHEGHEEKQEEMPELLALIFTTLLYSSRTSRLCGETWLQAKAERTG